jgi:hypothetical protein
VLWLHNSQMHLLHFASMQCSCIHVQLVRLCVALASCASRVTPHLATCQLQLSFNTARTIELLEHNLLLPYYACNGLASHLTHHRPCLQIALATSQVFTRLAATSRDSKHS